MLARGIIGVVSVVAWFFVFLAGLTISSQPYRQALLEGEVAVRNLLMTLLIYTPTNAAILCMLSGIIGAIAYSVVAQHGVKRPIGVHPAATVVAGMLRSFVIFLVFISGVYIGASDAFGSTGPEQYARVVATTCLLSFIVSYNPRQFGKVVGWFAPPDEADDDD